MQAEYLADLLEYLGMRPAVLFGTSHGATLCLHFALRFPLLTAGTAPSPRSSAFIACLTPLWVIAFVSSYEFHFAFLLFTRVKNSC